MLRDKAAFKPKPPDYELHAHVPLGTVGLPDPIEVVSWRRCAPRTRPLS